MATQYDTKSLLEEFRSQSTNSSQQKYDTQSLLDEFRQSQASGGSLAQPVISTMNEEDIAIRRESFANPAERLFLSLGNSEGVENYLKSKYSIVKRVGDNNFLAGDSINTLQPLDRDGISADLLGDLSEFIPTATQIGASVAAGAFGGPPGAALAGAGTEFAKKAVGRASGINTQDNLSAGTDILISGLGSGLAEKLNLFLKGLPEKEMTKKAFGLLANMVKKNGSAVEQSRSARMIAKIFSVTSGADEDKVLNLFKYTPDEVFKAENGSSNQLLEIVSNFADYTDSSKNLYGNILEKSTENLVNNTSKFKVNTSNLQKSVLTSMKQMGLVDDSGFVSIDNIGGNKEKAAFIKLFKQLGGDISEIKVSTGVVPGIGSPRTRRINALGVNQGAETDIKDLLSMDKQVRSLIEELKNKPESQFIFGNLRFGNEKLGTFGLMDEVANLANKAGDKGFLNARFAYKQFMDTVDNLRSYGINSKNKLTIENLIKGSSNMPDVVRAEINKLQGYMGQDAASNFIRRMEIWDTAQAFKVMNPNLIRFNTIASALGLGGFALGDTPENKAANVALGLAGAAALATPYGAGKIIQAGYKLRPPSIKVPANTLRTGLQTLGNLIKTKNFRRRDKSDNSAK